MQDRRPSYAGQAAASGSPEILVVCTGNVCRSPMAEALLRHHFQRSGRAVRVHSAGVLGWNSAGATDHTITALAERGVDLDGHVSRKMNAALIAPALVVITMTNDHMDAVRNHHDEAAARTFVLGQLVRLGEKHGPRTTEGVDEWLAAVDALRLARRRRALPNDEIRDPLGEPLEAYQMLARQLDDLTTRLVGLLAGSDEALDTAAGAGGGLAADISQDVGQ